MSLLGVHLSLMMGESNARRVPFSIAEALTSVEVTHKDSGPSGFSLTFQIGRSGPLDLLDYALLKNPLVRPFVRVVLLVRFAIVPKVLMDGIITHVQVTPSEEPGASTLTVTGEDVSVMMDLEEEHSSHPARSDFLIVLELLAKYSQYGLIFPDPPAANPQALNPRNPLEERTERTANLTDRAYIRHLAELYGFLFYVTPGPFPHSNTVHWGPPERLSIPQGTLSVNMGPASNTESIHFQFDPMAPKQVTFMDGDTERTLSRPSQARITVPLASDTSTPKRKTFLTDGDTTRVAIRAQSEVDKSFDDVVTATGELDTMRYNGLLNPRGLVGLRGVGKTYDGLYYVKSVTHNISRGRYTQNFSLSREGTGTTTPFVLPNTP
jgi:hypothetical protein